MLQNDVLHGSSSSILELFNIVKASRKSLPNSIANFLAYLSRLGYDKC
jgi:hypothetical protein